MAAIFNVKLGNIGSLIKTKSGRARFTQLTSYKNADLAMCVIPN